MSAAPDWSDAKAALNSSGTNLTLVASPRIPAAARQKSASNPFQLPWLSSVLRPVDPPVDTPQSNSPRALMAFTVSPGGRRACNAEADHCRNRRGKSDRCAHRQTLRSFSLFIGSSSAPRSFLVAPFVLGFGEGPGRER